MPAAFPAGGRQAAGFFIIVLQGQRACGGFFQGPPWKRRFSARYRRPARFHIALSLNTQGQPFLFDILKLKVVTSGVAHIDLYVFQG